jgi:DUF2933 family protein
MTSETSDRLAATARAAFIGFCVIAALFLIYEHTMHVLGVLPYLLLLACPLMHMFMHHGHGHGGHGHDGGVAALGSLASGRAAQTRDNGGWKETDHA